MSSKRWRCASIRNSQRTQKHEMFSSSNFFINFWKLSSTKNQWWNFFETICIQKAHINFCVWARSVFSSLFVKQKGWPNYWWRILGDPSPIKNSWFWNFSYEPFFEKFVHSVNITDSSQFIDHFQNNFDQTSWIFNQSVYKCVVNVSKYVFRKIGSATMG